MSETGNWGVSWKWKVLIGAVGFVLLSAITTSLWYHSQADIRQVIAQAKAAGMATTGAELGWKDPTPEQKARMERVLAFATSLPSWRSIGDNLQKYPRLGVPSPPELQAHLTSLPQDDLHAFDLAVDTLGQESWFLHGHVDAKTRFDEDSAQRKLVQLLGEQIRLAEVAKLPDLTRRGLRLSVLAREQNLRNGFTNRSCLATLASDLTARFSDLIGTAQGRLIAEQLWTMRDRLWRERMDPWAGEMVVVLASVDLYEEYTPWWHTSGSLPGSLKGMGEFLLQPVVCRIDWRIHRARRMLGLMDIAKDYAQAVDPNALATKIPPALPYKPPSIWARLAGRSWAHYFSLNYSEARSGILNSFMRPFQTLDVLIAELEQTAPANDLFAKPGDKVRPIMRDGKRIGWYSVGSDRVDDGGMVTKDFAVPIGEKPGRPNFSDPLEPRVPPALPPPAAP